MTEGHQTLAPDVWGVYQYQMEENAECVHMRFNGPNGTLFSTHFDSSSNEIVVKVEGLPIPVLCGRIMYPVARIQQSEFEDGYELVLFKTDNMMWSVVIVTGIGEQDELDPESAVRLGALTVGGEGINLIERAASICYPPAMLILAQHIGLDEGGDGIALLKKAALVYKYPEALHNLGLIEIHRIHDIENGVRHLEEAGEIGFANSYFVLGHLFSPLNTESPLSTDYESAIRFYEQGTRIREDKASMEELIKIYESREQTKQDAKRIKELKKKAEKDPQQKAKKFNVKADIPTLTGVGLGCCALLTSAFILFKFFRK